MTAATAAIRTLLFLDSTAKIFYFFSSSVITYFKCITTPSSTSVVVRAGVQVDFNLSLAFIYIEHLSRLLLHKQIRHPRIINRGCFLYFLRSSTTAVF